MLKIYHTPWTLAAYEKLCRHEMTSSSPPIILTNVTSDASIQARQLQPIEDQLLLAKYTCLTLNIMSNQ